MQNDDPEQLFTQQHMSKHTVLSAFSIMDLLQEGAFQPACKLHAAFTVVRLPVAGAQSSGVRAARLGQGESLSLARPWFHPAPRALTGLVVLAGIWSGQECRGNPLMKLKPTCYTRFCMMLSCHIQGSTRRWILYMVFTNISHIIFFVFSMDKDTSHNRHVYPYRDMTPGYPDTYRTLGEISK